MRSYLVNVNERKAMPIDIDPTLENMYATLNVGTIDIVVRRIKGKEFDIVCDDEGLLKDDIRPSAISPEGKVMLVGNLLFFHHDNEGNLTELSGEDIELLQDCTMFWIKHVFISECEY